ncbi:type 1 glutamine amidotransferase [Methylacidiphilales bacterium]|nr:type 1 glutamine amidotransferase [Candidatus Methylacidiphilales bacterium]
MRINVLQHAAFEGPGEIGAWAASHGHAMRTHHLYRGEELPALDSFDALVVMGGEMNIYQDRDYPWLKPERKLIQTAMEQGKRVIGICLGSQLIADALGARVHQNPEYEIGWFPVTFTGEGRGTFPQLPVAATVLHWHGDTFELPAGATRLAASTGCSEQGFFIEEKCLALQFHLETDPLLVGLFVEGQGHWPSGLYAQSPKVILSEATAYHDKNREILHGLLDQFFKM